MAIEFIGATNASTVGSTIAVDYPAGVVEGDCIVMVLRTWNATFTEIPQSGWQRAVSNTWRGGGNNLNVSVHVVPANDPGWVQVNLAPNGNHHVNLLALRGVDPNSPVNAVAQAYSSSGASNFTRARRRPCPIV